MCDAGGRLQVRASTREYPIRVPSKEPVSTLSESLQCLREYPAVPAHVPSTPFVGVRSQALAADGVHADAAWNECAIDLVRARVCLFARVN